MILKFSRYSPNNRNSGKIWDKLLYFICVVSFISCHQKTKTDSLYIAEEIAGKMAVSANNELFYSKKSKDKYILYRYKNDSVTAYHTSAKDIFNPFFIKDSLYWMVDDNGDENFTIESPNLRRQPDFGPFKELFTSPNSNIVVYSEKTTKDLYLYDLENSRKQKLLTFKNKINGVDFAKNDIVVSVDESLYLVDPRTYAIRLLASNLKGDKLNPFIAGNEVYFVNNSLREFYGIYKTELNENSKPEFCYGTNNDLRMPKVYNHKLFFLEIFQSKYLLSFIDKDQVKKRITNDGVVFTYNMVDNKVLFTLSTLNLPRSLCKYDLASGKTKIYTSNRPNTNLTGTFLTKNSLNSYGYKIASHSKVSDRGVILFIRGGGKETDFSPRWDDVLVNLAENGYVIYAPNFVSSIGYGKSYKNHSSKEALLDLADWEKYITNKHPNSNLYLLSSSSGNLYMEEILKKESANVKASASIFGIYSGDSHRSFFPMLYILGKKDPHLNLEDRLSSINNNSFFKINKKVVVYDNEGHWLRRSKNIEDAIVNIINYFD